jgi:hypothetical protein
MRSAWTPFLLSHWGKVNASDAFIFRFALLRCGRMEHLQRFTGAKRSCKQGLAKRRTRHVNKQQEPTQHGVAPCSCAELAQLAQAGVLLHPVPHQQLLQQQQQQVGPASPWQLPAGFTPTEATTDYAEQVSRYSQGSGYTASLSGMADCSLDGVSCGDVSDDSLEGLADAELEAMIEHELRAAAAALPAAAGAATGGDTASTMQQMPAAVLPTNAALPVATAAAIAIAAQHARLQMLMAEYAELGAALQQLQQASGLMRQAGSGSVTTSYLC